MKASPSPWAVKAADAPDVRRKLQEGFRIMEEFGWDFPHDPTSTAYDTATQAFDMLYSVVKELRRVNTSGEVDPALDAEFKQEWPGVLKFLVSMYECGKRNTYKVRIKHVAEKLQLMSPTFGEEVTSRGSTLPWVEETEPEESPEGTGLPGESPRDGALSGDEPEAPFGEADSPSGSQKSADFHEAEEPKRGIVWIDRDETAFEGSILHSQPDVCFKGFHDEAARSFTDRAPWMDYVYDKIGTASEVSVVMMNFRHHQFIIDLSERCKALKCKVPSFIVCSNAPLDAQEFASIKDHEGNKVSVQQVANRKKAAELALAEFRGETKGKKGCNQQ